MVSFSLTTTQVWYNKCNESHRGDDTDVNPDLPSYDPDETCPKDSPDICQISSGFCEDQQDPYDPDDAPYDPAKPRPGPDRSASARFALTKRAGGDKEHTTQLGNNLRMRVFFLRYPDIRNLFLLYQYFPCSSLFAFWRFLTRNCMGPTTAVVQIPPEERENWTPPPDQMLEVEHPVDVSTRFA